jgi:proteasome activator subunit 4
MYLEKFLKTIETYFYPANFGRWMGKLKELLIKLPYYFILRLHKYVDIYTSCNHNYYFSKNSLNICFSIIAFNIHICSHNFREKYAKPTWENQIPNNYKLTDTDIDAFVKNMLPVAMTAMFSKFGVNDACYALQHLATMRPNLVIPDMLERMYSTFNSLTEPHKLTASMICMVAVARPMVQGSRNVNKGMRLFNYIIIIS